MQAAVNTEPQTHPAWHAVGVDDVAGELDTDPARGLDAGEAARLAQFRNILVYILLAAGFVKLLVGLWLDAAVILGVVLLNTYAPPFQALFHTAAVPLDEWPWLVLGGLVFFLVVEAEKLVIRMATGKQEADGAEG